MKIFSLFQFSYWGSICHIFHLKKQKFHYLGQNPRIRIRMGGKESENLSLDGCSILNKSLLLAELLVPQVNIEEPKSINSRVPFRAKILMYIWKPTRIKNKSIPTSLLEYPFLGENLTSFFTSETLFCVKVIPIPQVWLLLYNIILLIPKYRITFILLVNGSKNKIEFWACSPRLSIYTHRLACNFRPQ